MDTPKEIKQKLIDLYGIKTDRDLLEQLGITDEEDKKKLFLWIRYQCAFSYREGLEVREQRGSWLSAADIVFDTPIEFLLEHGDEQLTIFGVARKAGDYWDLIPASRVEYDRSYWNCNKWRHL